MQEHLNCVLKLSLEEMALRTWVVSLWNQPDILELHKIGRYEFSSHFSLQEGVKLIKNRLSELTLPKSVLQEVTPLIHHVGTEILNWEVFHQRFFNHPHLFFVGEKHECSETKFDRKVIEKLSWTSAGSIDYRKTAEELIRFEMLDSLQLYKLACFYCLENLIPVVWQKLPTEFKECYSRKISIPHLNAFWKVILLREDDGFFFRGSFENTPSFYEQAFMKAACMGNKAATEYFYQKLTDEERNFSLLKRTMDALAGEVYYPMASLGKSQEARFSDVACYLLCQMSPDERTQLLKKNPYDTLRYFLHWPYQNLFFAAIELTWDYLPEVCYHCLLLQLVTAKTAPEYVNAIWFQELFRRSPDKFKKYFAYQECVRGIILYKAFRSEEGSKVIRCIFRNVDAATKWRLVSSSQGFLIFSYIIQEDKWNLLQLFIEATRLSKVDREGLKTYLKQQISECYQEAEYERKIQKCESLFHPSNEIVPSKRSLKDEVTQTKKLFCAE